ncbi:Oidioi.mRNA.OKI2018_I69.chr1.g1101.t1.cds [Oikopleura dioica]|uniref:Oidioi.mRNA.OKI2018_I69.chr1.g1101.t1.cds n=1 Tax=Oikopleura dioica TaxID=34765 RepID=A0ABN7SQN5_OIKDI|nr:Oidioi.mRNA.OKI2018_I69.chr1.g1101.t1.cds [Oikopleura dioica]
MTEGEVETDEDGESELPDLPNVEEGFPTILVPSGSAVIKFNSNGDHEQKGFELGIREITKADLIEKHAEPLFDSLPDNRFGTRYYYRLTRSFVQMNRSFTGKKCFKENGFGEEALDINAFDENDMCKLNRQLYAAINSFAKNFACKGRGKSGAEMSAELNIFLNLERNQTGPFGTGSKEPSLSSSAFSSDESGLGISSESQSEDSSSEEQMENPPSYASITSNPRLEEDLTRISDDIGTGKEQFIRTFLFENIVQFPKKDSILASYDQNNLAVQVHTTFQAVRRQRPAREVRTEKINFCHSHVHPGVAIYRQEFSRTPSPTDDFTDSIHPMLFFDNTRRLLQRRRGAFENSFEEDLELGDFSPDEMDEGDFAFDIVDDLLKSSSSSEEEEEDSEGSLSDSEEDDTLCGADELKSESIDPEPIRQEKRTQLVLTLFFKGGSTHY